MAFGLSENETKLAGQLAIVLSAVFCVATIAVPIVNKFTPKPIDIGLDVSIPYLVGVLALFITYVYGRLEHAITREEYIISQPFEGVELFQTSDTFLQRLTELTVGSTSVSTLNLSSPIGHHHGLDTYFKNVHEYILKPNAELQSFRSLASVDSYHKLEWLVKRAAMLAPSGRSSFAVLKQVTVGAIPLGFHVIVRGPDGYVFFFPPVNLTGQMQAFLIKNRAVADIVVHYFDMLWTMSPVISQGKIPSKSGLEFLWAIDQRIQDNTDFQQLLRAAE